MVSVLLYNARMAKVTQAAVCLFLGMGHIHMSEIQCNGFEKSIIDCKFNAQSTGCNHEEDAAVRCNVPAMNFQNQVKYYFFLPLLRKPYHNNTPLLEVPFWRCHRD